MEFLTRVFLCFLRSSLSTGIFILLVMAIIMLFGEKMNVRIKNALWVLILIKLLIPVSDHIDSNLFSILNQRYLTLVQSEQIVTSGSAGMNQPLSDMNSSMTDEASENSENNNFLPAILQIASVIWLTGVVLLSIFLLITNYNFRRKNLGTTNTGDGKTLALIQRWKANLSIKQEIRVVINDRIKSPCITGIIKPTIYIPEYILNISNSNQISHIFIHELVHFKRKDVLYNLLSIIALLIHWYNPLAWIAVKKMRIYRECTCDACVLELLNEDENIEYGMTLLNISKSYFNKNEYTQMPIYFETNNQMKERINMIKKFSKGSNKVTFKMALSCVIAACIILSNNLQVKALNTENMIRSVSNGPGLKVGWYQQNDKWYYRGELLKDEEMVVGNVSDDWLFDTGLWYYFDKQGVMVHDITLTIDGKNYDFATDGHCTNKIETGWQLDCNDKWYFFDENGVMLKNTTVNGKNLDENGILIPESSFISEDKSKYPGWYQQNDKWRCKLGGEDLVSTWLKTGNGKWFYFDHQGNLVFNTTLRIGSKDYVFADNGLCTNKNRGWEYYDGKWHYYNENGEVLKNTVVDGYKIDGDGYRIETGNSNTSAVEDHSRVVGMN
ncbi:M56 family metallopeptidase [Lacrimispora sp.]|uniref:M56 family metallopeptidase n=1 Tax=Lacrimispora sp. TaxID=2719234 RepID=UPI0032E422E6